MSSTILNRQKKLKVDIKRAARALRRVLTHLSCRDKEVNVVYLDDEGIRVFNREYLGRDKPTNVISFAMTEGEFGGLNPGVLGDVLISVDRAERDTAGSSLSLDEMLDYLMIHGILHLLGYDHESDSKSASEMKKKEEELFSLLHGRPIDALRPQT